MLVSVYMPTQNRVAHLAKAIDSVFSQTYSNIELIVVNDASSDGTEEYLRGRSQSEPRLTHFTNSKPKGASASRNIAILQSRGEFLTGLDDDDQFLAKRIEAFVENWNLLTETGLKPSCLYAQDVLLADGVQRGVSQKRNLVSVDDLFEHNHIGNQIFAPRAHFIEVGLFDERLPAWQDLEFFLRMLEKFGTAHLVDLPTYLFDVTRDPKRISSRESRIREAFEIVAKKHSMGLSYRKRMLFLQIFQSGYYNIPLRFLDCVRLIRWGQGPRGLLRFWRTMVTNRSWWDSMVTSQYRPST